MRRFLACLSVVLVTHFVGNTPAHANSRKPADHPGYVDLQRLAQFGKAESQVEVYLTEPLLRLVQAAGGNGLGSVLKGLKLIQVHTFPVGKAGVLDMAPAADSLIAELEEAGWVTVVRVREDEEHVAVCFKPDGDRLAGIFVVAIESGDEAALVNIVGGIDPAQIARIGEQFNVGALLELEQEVDGSQVEREDSKSGGTEP